MGKKGEMNKYTLPYNDKCFLKDLNNSCFQMDQLTGGWNNWQINREITGYTLFVLSSRREFNHILQSGISFWNILLILYWASKVSLEIHMSHKTVHLSFMLAYLTFNLAHLSLKSVKLAHLSLGVCLKLAYLCLKSAHSSHKSLEGHFDLL